MKKRPRAMRVRVDQWGVSCLDCLGVVVLDRWTTKGPIYRHIESHPPCLRETP